METYKDQFTCTVARSHFVSCMELVDLVADNPYIKASLRVRAGMDLQSGKKDFIKYSIHLRNSAIRLDAILGRIKKESKGID